MQNTLQILHLEDSELDAELVRHALAAGDFSCQIDWVNNFSDYQQALESSIYDLVLSDYSLPDCDGLKAFAQTRQLSPPPPFILITGALGEELAIDTLKAGVTDYVLKSNLVRLQTAVPRAIEDVRLAWEKQATLDALRVSEERFDLAVRGSGAGIWDWADLSVEQMWWSPRIYEMLGYQEGRIPATRSQLYGMMHPDDVEVAQGVLQLHFTEQQPYDVEFRIRTTQDQYIWLRSRGQAVWDAEGKPLRMAGYIQDITDRKQAEAARRRADQQYRTIARSAVEAFIMINASGEIQLWNPAAERIFGYSEAEILGRDLHQLLAPEEFQPQAQRGMQAFVATGRGDVIGETVEIEGLTKAGKRVPLEISLNAVRQGNEWHAIGVLRDITERKEAEAQRLELEMQLRQTQKMEAIGTLAGGIAHDFNNILASILGYGSMVERRLPKDSREQTDMREVLKAAERAKQLVRQILTFSRKSGIEKQPVQVDLIIQEVLQLIRASFPSTINVVQSLVVCGESILADATQVHQVLMNLCTNAYHAMPSGGTLSVSLGKCELAEQNDWGLAAGPYLELKVKDTGTGIDPELLERIFDPYFTTKDVDNGTGLGLSVVRGIITSLGGQIRVSSCLEKGTCFTLMLPCLQEENVPQGFEVDSADITGEGNIMLVDDETSLALLGKEFLEDLGYNVIAQTSSLAALEHLKRHHGQFDLVITDQTMPRMTGIELARNLSDLAPELPVVLCSGLKLSLDTEGIAETSICHVLLKTDLFDQLPKLLKKLLGRGGNANERKDPDR